jgi:hypothetical protein
MSDLQPPILGAAEQVASDCIVVISLREMVYGHSPDRGSADQRAARGADAGTTGSNRCRRPPSCVFRPSNL